MTTDDIIRIADGLDQNVQIDPQTSEDEPGGYRSELDELMAHAAAILRSQHARIAELEAQLYAIGAGGVGQSIKPQVQADTAPIDIITLARAAGFEIGSVTGSIYAPAPCQPELERFATLVAAAERRKHQADIERWKAEAATAEKWRGLALSKEGDGRCVQRIQQEAAEKEREACAQTCEERHANGNYQHDTRHECAEAIRARGQP